MSTRRYINHNSAFTDYAYHFLLTAKEEEKKNLSTEELKIFRDHISIKKFCSHEPHDKIKLYLTKMGLTWIEIWGKSEEQIHFAMSSAQDQNMFDQKRTDLIEKMAREQIYATSDRELSFAYSIAQNAHSEVYALSAETKEIKKLSASYKQRAYSLDDEVNDVNKAYSELNKLLLAQLNSFDWAKEALNLEQNEVRILCALFDKRNSCMTMQELAEQTMLEGRKAYLKTNIEKLEADKLIQSDKSKANRKYGKQIFYLISGLGIKKMVQYRIHIHKMAYKK